MKYALLLLLSSVAQAATYSLPDPAITVDLRTPGTTYVTVGGVTYRGASAFYPTYEPCNTTPVGRFYTCHVSQEDNVLLTASDQTTITVSIKARFEHWLNVSGHNYYRNRQTVLSGEVTTP